MSDDSADDVIEDCLICLEPLTRRVLLPCGHSPACLRCFVTYNLCYGKRICPFCQREINDDPIITDSSANSTYGLELFKGYKHDTNFHFYFKDPAVIEELKSYQKFKCPKCGETLKNFKVLTQHLKSHKMTTCKICYNAKRFLPSQTPVFAQNEIKKHLKQHPKCPVCPFTAFDQSQLNEHMRENHFRCEICAEQGKILWFENLELLQVHLHSQHYACEDPLCVEQGFIAFATEFELQMHQINVHGAKIPLTLDFKEEAQQKEPDFRNEHRKRINQAKKKLGQVLKSTLQNETDSQSVFTLIQNLQNQKVSVHKFLKELNKICGESTDGLFCDVVAAIGNPRIRASVVKARQGIRPCRVPNSYSMPHMSQNYPTIDSENQQKTETQHKTCSSNDDSDEGKKGKNEKVQSKKSKRGNDDDDNNNNRPPPPPAQPPGGKKKQKKIIITSF